MLNSRPCLWWIGVLPALLALAAGLPKVGFAENDGDRAKVAKLIDALGSDSASERDDAYEALRTFGEIARPALEKAVRSNDPLVRDSVRRLLLALEKASEGSGPDGSLRLKDRFGRPPGESAPPFPSFPFLKRDEQEWEGSVEEWNRDLENWNREFGEWMNEMLEGRGWTAIPPRAESDPLGAGSFSGSRTDLDGTTAYEMKVSEEGRVTLHVKRTIDGETREESYEAESMDELVKLHPEVAKELWPPDGRPLRPMILDPFSHGFRFPGLSVPRAIDPRDPFQPFAAPAPRSISGPRLGVQVRVLDEDDPIRAHVALDPGMGLLVVEVSDDTLAAELGVRKNDIIVRVGDTPVGEPADVAAALRAAEDDGEIDLVEVTVVRQGAEVVLSKGV